MEKENNLNADCGCSDGCCVTPKRKPWKKVLFILVFLVAASIVTMKLTSKNNGSVQQNINASDTSQSHRSDSVATDGNKTCSTSGKSTCCPQNKK